MTGKEAFAELKRRTACALNILNGELGIEAFVGQGVMRRVFEWEKELEPQIEDTVPLIREMRDAMERQCEICGPGFPCRDTECDAYKAMVKADEFLKKYGVTT